MAFVFVKLILRTAIITGIVGGLFIIIINSSQFVQGQNNASPDALVFPVDSKPYGKSYADWSAIWWQWLVASFYTRG